MVVLLFRDVVKIPDFFHPLVLLHPEKLSQALKMTVMALDTTSKLQGRNEEQEKVEDTVVWMVKAFLFSLTFLMEMKTSYWVSSKLSYPNVSLDRTY